MQSFPRLFFQPLLRTRRSLTGRPFSLWLSQLPHELCQPIQGRKKLAPDSSLRSRCVPRPWLLWKFFCHEPLDRRAQRSCSIFANYIEKPWRIDARYNGSTVAGNIIVFGSLIGAALFVALCFRTPIDNKAKRAALVKRASVSSRTISIRVATFAGPEPTTMPNSDR